MKDKLIKMMKKGTFAAYRLTENNCLEILGRNRKIVDHYFLFDGEHYYFRDQLIQFTSTETVHDKLLLALTDTKLLIPKNNEDYLYIARNFPANKDLFVVVLYYYNDYLYFSVVCGNGSGRVHHICLPFTGEGLKFCFHFAIEAIAAVHPETAEALCTTISQKLEKVNDTMAGCAEQIRS